MAESTVLAKLGRADYSKFGFPKMESQMVGSEQSEILMEALGVDLKTIQSKQPNGRFSVPTCLFITIQLLDLIEKLHSLNFIHNDIKMENIMIGRKDP
jgi:serine/threonine protein kinase